MKIPENPRLPTSNNPIKIRKLILYPDNLIYKNKQYKYNEVKHLNFDWYSIQQIRRGSIGDLSMEFRLPGIKKIVNIKTVDNMLINISMKRFEEFYCGYSYLSKMSYYFRYQDYMSEFDEKGYFKNSGYIFLKDRVTDNNSYEEILNDGSKYIKMTKLGIMLFTIKEVETTLINKVLPFPPNMCGLFGTEYDSDVLLKIFEEFYGLSL